MAEALLADNVQAAVMQGMSMEASGAAGTRVRRWDQLAADTASMWAGYLTTPTVLAGKGAQIMTEAGSGRTRAETNNPANTGAMGGT